MVVILAMVFMFFYSVVYEGDWRTMGYYLLTILFFGFGMILIKYFPNKYQYFNFATWLIIVGTMFYTYEARLYNHNMKFEGVFIICLLHFTTSLKFSLRFVQMLVNMGCNYYMMVDQTYTLT